MRGHHKILLNKYPHISMTTFVTFKLVFDNI